MHKLILLTPLSLMMTAQVGFAAPLAMITNQSADSVHVYRTDNWNPVTVIPLGTGAAPSGIAIPASGGFALVANRGTGTVARIDLPPTNVSATFSVPGNPTSVAVTPDGSVAYVVQSTNCPAPAPTPGPTPTAGPTPTPGLGPPCTVAAIDTGNGTILAEITVGRQPFAVAMSPSGESAYVTNRSDGTLSVIDVATNSVTATVPVGATPEGVSVGSGEIFVANEAADTVSILREVDLQPVPGSPVAVGAGPLGVTVSPNGKTAVVSNDTGATVSLLSARTLATLATPPVGTNPSGIGILPDSSAAIVADNTNNAFSVVTLPAGQVTSFPIVGAPVGVAITPEPHYSLEKLASQNPVVAGGDVTYTIAYSNNGSGNATNVTLIDPIPQGLTFVSASAGGGVQGSNVVWTIPAIPAGGSGNVEVTFSIANTTPDQSQLVNAATISDVDGNTATASSSVTVRASVLYSLALTGRPNPVVPAGQLVYTLTYGNTGVNTATSTVLDMTYDPNVTFVSAIPAPDTGSTTHWTIGDLVAGGTGSITIMVSVATPLPDGTLLATQAQMSDAAGDTGSTVAINTVENFGLVLTGSGSPDPVAADGTLLYEFTYSNTSSRNLAGLLLAIVYDPNVTFVTSDAPPDQGTTNEFTIPTIPAGTTGHVGIQVKVTHVIPNGTVLHTTAQIIDHFGNSASTGVDTAVQSAPTLVLTKNASPDPVVPGGTLTYTLTYSNPGSDTATGVVVSETYPPEVSFVSANPTPDTGTNDQWTIGSLAPGASGSISVVTTATAANGPIAFNQASVADGAGHSSTATSTTVIATVPALNVGIVGGPNPVSAGGLLTYTINYGNTLGTSAATGVVLTANFPPQASFISASLAPDSGTNNRWTLGSIAAGGSGSITVSLAIPDSLPNGTALTGTATIRDDALHSATASTTTLVFSSSNLQLAATSDPNPVAVGGVVTYQVSLGNQGTAPVSGVVLNEAYDPNLTFVSATPPPDFGQNATWTLGTLAPGAADAIVITLQVNPSTPSGTILLSEGTLTSAGAGLAQVVELDQVGTAPLQLTLNASPDPVTAGSVLSYVLTYTNTTGQAINGLGLSFGADARTVFLSSTPSPISDTLTWSVDVPAHGSGTINLSFLAGAPPGAIVTAHATAANGVQNVSAVSNVVTQGGSSLDKVTLTRYYKFTPNVRPIDRFITKATFDFFDTLNPSGGLGFVLGTRDRVLAAVWIPPGKLSASTAKILHYNGPSFVPGGGAIHLSLSQIAGGKLRFSLTGTHYNLPMSDSLEISEMLFAPVDRGGQGFTAVHDFRKLSRSTLSSEFLVYP